MDTKTSIHKNSLNTTRTVNILKCVTIQLARYALVYIGSFISQIYLVL